MINRHKIHRIVEYIKLFEFEFEVVEVIENLYSILSSYDLLDMALTDDEYNFLKNELLPLAENFEFAEVSRLTLPEESLMCPIEARFDNGI